MAFAREVFCLSGWKLVYGGGEERREAGSFEGKGGKAMQGNASKSWPICNYGISDGFGTN